MSEFSLDLPSTEKVKEEVKQQLMPTEKEKMVIQDVVKEKGDAILSVDLDSLPERMEFVKAMESFGSELVQSSRTKNNILEKQMGNFSKAGGESGEVAKSLEELSIKMRDLDPSKLDFTKTGFMGKFFNPVRRYFERYKTADREIADIIKSLDKGRNTLKNDNTTLEIEMANMRDMTKQLNQKISLGIELDEYLARSIEEIRYQPGNEEKVSFFEEEILFPLRQRIMDFQQLLTVNQQGIVAMEIIRKNNLELIRAVDRSKLVTVNALRTAVTVAGALYNQRIVLEKVEILNATTNHMIDSTSRMLKEQGVAVQNRAMNANISTDNLKQAFANTLSAFEDIQTYKQKALPQMQQTIQEFKEMAEQGELRLRKMEEKKLFS